MTDEVFAVRKPLDPDVFVVLKDGDSYGEKDGMPLCVEIDESTARLHKIGRCVKYIPAAHVSYFTELAKEAISVLRILERDGGVCTEDERAGLREILERMNILRER